jgi:hypothetical protein
MARRGSTWVIAVIAISIVIAFFVSFHLRTSAKIKVYRASIKPGMTLTDLTNMMGRADRIIGPDRQLDRAHHYKIPPLGSNTVVYFYPKEGLPYYNLFVFVDTEKREVTELVIDKLK